MGILRECKYGGLDVRGEVRPCADDLFQVIGKRGRTANIMFRNTTLSVREVIFRVRDVTGVFGGIGVSVLIMARCVRMVTGCVGMEKAEWWRRRESNPRPESLLPKLLRT